MAEGTIEEESADMLGPTLTPLLQNMQTAIPTNLSCKEEDEESECESSVGSPEPASLSTDTGTDLTVGTRHSGHNRQEESDNSNECKASPNPQTTHLNGAMAGLVTLQNFHNFASTLQNLPQVASSLAAVAAATAAAAGGGLSSPNMSPNATATTVNAAPLNLSVNASAISPRLNQTSSCPATTESLPLPPQSQPTPNIMSTVNRPPSTTTPIMHSHATTPNQNNLIGGTTPQQQPAPMPQFILASGQLVQGIQGAQLLIPTSQGLATQTILTIPVNHVNSADQMVNLALNNGQVMQTSLANLQAMSQSNLLNNHSQQGPPTSNGTLLNHHPNLVNSTSSSTLNHLLSNGTAAAAAAAQLLQSLPQLLNNNPQPPQSQSQAAVAQQPQLKHLAAPKQQPLPHLQMLPTSNTCTAQTRSNNQPQQQLMTTTSSTASSALSTSPYADVHTKMLHQQQQQHQHHHHMPSPPLVGSRVLGTQNNGEISISTSATAAAQSSGNSSSQSMKRSSPSSLSPNCTDSSTADLLIDSPNQPTINQVNTNVVDGINLDEIKDFAKAFKLRRLSLGLTQTQVGQALSVTEGPAYSQSAICSALASQMFAAAQLSTQHQAMFEKLDITPKSAQKIKPVLERWMKEAEDRYKSGQNHLTDFIGIEPSKKRKRRTSFTPQALELLNAHFERNTHPSGTEITGLAHQLGYEREVIRIWFCNKRQALKNTVRMMSKGMV